MADWLVEVTRTVTLAVRADGRMAAQEAAFGQAWEWQPESAAAGDQGSVRVRVKPASRQRSTKLAGHGLRAEGKPVEPDGYGKGGYLLRRGFLGRALCECGERSPDLDSNAGRQRWHAEHKVAVRKQQEKADG